MSKLLIDEPPLQALPSLAVAIGLNEAIFLQQLHYWLTTTAKYKPHFREYEGVIRPWIYNTYHTKKDEKETGWQANFPFWSVRTIKRIVTSLKEKGLIVTTDQFNTASSNRTLWYTIDYDKLEVYEKPPTGGTLDSDKLALSEGDKLALSRGGQVGTLMTETSSETSSENGGENPPTPPPTKKQQTLTPESELDIWFTNAATTDEPEDAALRQIETVWQKKRIAHDTKLAMAAYHLAMQKHNSNLEIPRDKTTQGKWAAGVTDHLDNYSLADLKRLYPLAIKHAQERGWDIYSPQSLTLALAKVSTQQQTAPAKDYKSDPQYQAFE